MTKLLRIGIPTYNRGKLVLKLLEYIKGELNLFLTTEIEIVVSDNASEDDTQQIVENFKKANPWFTYQRNNSNIGGPKNIFNMALESDAKFTWIVGDDDLLLPGLLMEVVTILKKHENLSWLFLNHGCIQLETNEIYREVAFSKNFGYQTDGRKVATDIFLESGTSLMFITSSILRTEYLKNTLQLKNSDKYELPLEWSFYSASMGPVYLMDKVYIYVLWGRITWKDDYYKVIYNGVLNTLNNLHDYSYSEEQINKMARTVIATFQWRQIKNLFSDNGFSFKLFKYYNINLVISLIIILKKKFLFKLKKII